MGDWVVNMDVVELAVHARRYLVEAEATPPKATGPPDHRAKANC